MDAYSRVDLETFYFKQALLTNEVYRILLIICQIACLIAHGAQSLESVVSALSSYIIYQQQYEQIENSTLKHIYIGAAACMVLGILTLGPRLSRRIGQDILHNLDFMKAFSIQFSCAFFVGISIIVPGLELSMSVCIIGAMYGVHKACSLDSVTKVYGNEKQNLIIEEEMRAS